MKNGPKNCKRSMHDILVERTPVRDAPAEMWGSKKHGALHVPSLLGHDQAKAGQFHETTRLQGEPRLNDRQNRPSVKVRENPVGDK